MRIWRFNSDSGKIQWLGSCRTYTLERKIYPPKSVPGGVVRSWSFDVEDRENW